MTGRVGVAASVVAIVGREACVGVEVVSAISGDAAIDAVDA